MKNARLHVAQVIAGLLCVTSLSGAQAQQAPAEAGGGQSAGGIRWETNPPPAVKSGPWTGPRTADGQPDVTGHWSNTIANHNNFEDPQGGSPGDRRAPTGPRESRAPSRVTDPADGRIPYQPWAKEKQLEFAANFANPTEPRFIEPLARCAPAGVPKSFYWHGYELRQYPGYILFLFDSGIRIIHLDGKPQLAENIKLWNADSRGRWEGNTLIVDVTNNNSKALFGRHGHFASENVRIEERFIFDNDGKRYSYVARFTDPTVYTRPWTATVPARRYTEADPLVGWHYSVNEAVHDGEEVIHERRERICVENNGAFAGGAVVDVDREPIIAR